MRKIIVAAMMVSLLATAGLAMAQDSEKNPGMGMGYGPHSGYGHWEGQGLWKALKLTPE